MIVAHLIVSSATKEYRFLTGRQKWRKAKNRLGRSEFRVNRSVWAMCVTLRGEIHHPRLKVNWRDDQSGGELVNQEKIWNSHIGHEYTRVNQQRRRRNQASKMVTTRHTAGQSCVSVRDFVFCKPEKKRIRFDLIQISKSFIVSLSRLLWPILFSSNAKSRIGQTVIRLLVVINDQY